jgi:hypothetical protein
VRTTERRREAARAQHAKPAGSSNELTATEQMLLHQYGGPVVPLHRVVTDFFPELTLDTFLRRHAAGEIALPLTRLNAASQKATRFVHLKHLAAFLDARAAVAVGA